MNKGPDNTTGNISEQAVEDLDSLGKNSNLLADSDAQASRSKKLFPQTGESLPLTPFLGILLILFACIIWFRKPKVQG